MLFRTGILRLAMLGAFLTATGRAAEKTKDPHEVLVVADALQNVPTALRPAPGQPIYYVLAKGEVTLGESVAGMKMPRAAEMEKAIVASLASQGFIRTEVGGPIPSIFILAMWGDANFADFSYRPEVDQNQSEEEQEAQAKFQATMDSATATARDRRKAENLVGTAKMLALPPGEMTRVMAASNEDRLYISLLALDAESFRQKKRKVLWRTSMTVDARHKLADMVPVMLASAAPFFGRNADTPIFADDNYRRNFEVQVGEAKVVREDTAPAPKK